jgi:hypothetical protein
MGPLDDASFHRETDRREVRPRIYRLRPSFWDSGCDYGTYVLLPVADYSSATWALGDRSAKGNC